MKYADNQIQMCTAAVSENSFGGELPPGRLLGSTIPLVDC
jgi:hypothetical protein